jgi:signal transduction histidine kinase
MMRRVGGSDLDLGLGLDLDDEAGQSERIRELEEELSAAKKTIAVLVRRLERGAQQTAGFSIFEAAARFEQLAAARTRELAEKSGALAAANEELRHLTENLDLIVRERTSALAASEASLQRKNTELDRLNRLKSEFISIAAHELRTPMTSVLGYSEMMLEQKLCPLPPELERPVAALHRNAQRLRRLIEDMLDVSRLEHGRMTLRLAQHDLNQVARTAIEEMEVYSVQRQHSVSLEPGPVRLVRVDGDKILQVIVNLLANAIKYTAPRGRIVVATGEEGGQAVVRVRDNGVGIPKVVRERLFEPFSNLTAAKHHSSIGPDSAGLGLYIARGIADLHGGELRVITEEGVGTEFALILPIES